MVQKEVSQSPSVDQSQSPSLVSPTSPSRVVGPMGDALDPGVCPHCITGLGVIAFAEWFDICAYCGGTGRIS